MLPVKTAFSAACSHRRRQVLDELPTNDVFGINIPQCEGDGKFYRAEQCRVGTEQCWCVNQYGRQIGSMHSKISDFREICQTIRNSFKAEPNWSLREEEEKAMKDVDNVMSESRREVKNVTGFENHVTLYIGEEGSPWNTSGISMISPETDLTDDVGKNDNRVRNSTEMTALL
ncbi:unnamed protein product, partial [Anisakis simplex]|uniref:Thyroglobulin type-1 domain-containing protein n=1 Tax=Anisakis simplex TaxID=6269 RepID=A0A0M3JKS7_ANISI